MIGIIQNAVGGCAEPWAKLIAEELHKNRYRKIPENAVVLETSVYESLEIKNYRDVISEETRKETAEKFAERLKARLNIPIDYLDEKDIDEICKEITEGKA